MSAFDDIKTAMGDLDEDAVKKLLADFAKQGGSGVDEALAACQAGMDVVGKKFETGEYFVADLIFAGELMNEAAAILKPFLGGASGKTIGKMALCTVKGDIHDIGKNITKALLEAGGIEVIDLGVDVAADRIIAVMKEQNIKVLALSGVLTLAIDSMKATVDALKAAGLRDTVKVLIGGAPVTADYCKRVGADAWSLNAPEGVAIVRGWLAG